MKIPEVFSTGFLIDGETYFLVSKGYCEKAKQLETSYGQVSKALCGKENATLEEILQEVSQVKSRLAQAERERDVMRPVFIREMKKYGCTTCEHYIPAAYTQECLGCGNSELKNWVWNGVCSENTKEE